LLNTFPQQGHYASVTAYTVTLQHIHSPKGLLGTPVQFLINAII